MQLLFAVSLFLLSALAIVIAATILVRASDALAEMTGLGRLFVGGLFLAIATSLPELLTTASAIQLGEPALALGDIFGANMTNMAVLGLVALLLGQWGLLQHASARQGITATVAILLTGTALLAGAAGEFPLGPFGLGTLLLVPIYVVGLWIIYRLRPAKIYQAEEEESIVTHSLSLRRAWTFFLLAALGILIAAPLLAFSATRIVEATGLAASFVGVALLAVITTLPESVATYTAVREGAPDLAVGDIYGSCAFNVFMFALLDPLHTAGPLLATITTAHIVAGTFAILLMGLGLLQLLVRTRLMARLMNANPGVLITVYIGGFILVYLTS